MTSNYMGDGVYARVEAMMIKLTTDNGRGPTNTIYLEPMVMEELIRFYNRNFDCNFQHTPKPDDEA